MKHIFLLNCVHCTFIFIYHNNNNNMIYKELIISGGSTNFMALLGALDCIYEKGLHTHFKRFIGTSVGSILALLLAVGYNPKTIQQFTLLSDFTQFNEITCDNVLSFFDDLGIISGDKIMIVVRSFLKVKNVPLDITLKQFKQKYKKSLYITTWCIHDKDTVCMSYHSHPDMPVLTAIRMSIAIPFLFKPVIWENKAYIDGGIIENLPVKYSKNKKTSIAINININTVVKNPLEITNYINTIVRCVSSEIVHLKKKLHKHPFVIDICLPDNPIINFDLEKETKLILFEIGKEQAHTFVTTHEQTCDVQHQDN